MSVLDPIHQAFAEVGPPEAIFGPPKLRIVVGALVMGLVGCVQLLVYCFPPDAVRAEQQADAVGLLIMGIGCLALAGGISAHGLRLRRRRFFVCPGGLVVTHGGHVDVYPWDNIVRVTENSERDTLFHVPVGTYRAAVVQRIDGAKLVLDRNRVKGVGKLIDAIQDQIWKRRSDQELLETDPDLKMLVAAWPSLPANVRTEILARVEKTAATGAAFGEPVPSNDLHVDLRVSQGQANRGETVTP